MVKILISNTTILTLSSKHELIIDNGYIFVNNGVVESVGKGEIPEEYQYPELLLSGKGRLVMPGISSGFTKIATYPIRYALPYVSSSDINEYLSVLTRTDVYYASLLAFTDLLYRGVTTLMISDIFLDDIARAANDAGLNVVLAPPINIKLRDYDPLHELKLIMQRWHGRVNNIYGGIAVYGGLDEEVLRTINEYDVKSFFIGFKELASLSNLDRNRLVLIDPYVDVVDGWNVVRTYRTLGLWRSIQGLGIGDLFTYDLIDVSKELLRLGHKGLDLLFSITTVTTSTLGFNDMGCIEEGRKANLVMLNLSEPPGWPLLNSVNALVNAVLTGRPKVESVIVGDNILVDGGEVLSIGNDLIKKASTRLEGIIKDLRIKGKLMF